MPELATLACVIVAVPVVLIAMAIVFAKRYFKVGPNEVLVISGGRRRRDGQAYRIVRGGGTFVLPVFERVDRLSMEVMTIDVVTHRVYTVQGVPITVDGVAQVSIDPSDSAIRTAAQLFLSKTEDEIRNVALQTLEGHLRAILGTLTVEEVYRDRDAFAQRVQEVSSGDMAAMGLRIISFTIKDIQDDQGYLDALGQKRTAEVKRDAAIGQAEAARDATIKSAEARQAGETAKFLAEARIAESQKNYAVQKAAFDLETNQRRAEADLAYKLQEAKTSQLVKEQEIQIEVVAKQKQIEVQEQEVRRREKELEATVRKPAEAERYRIETLADAERFKRLAEAQGQAAATQAIGEGEAAAIRARGLAEAEVIKAKGLAEAEIIRAQGFAEAEAMEKKAAAWKQYNQAAVIQQLIEALPQVAAAIAQPLAQTDRIVVISSGDGAGAGASKVTADIANIVAQVPATVEALTGVDLVKAISELPGLGQVVRSEP
ncbi:MAG: SPFH domain-containing protein [Caldilineales bacterium]|nr:SPFH domain-containing protein [Caldilineales bacterium]MDW8317820.1 SPFH domain-containing protein [Anaerolineae bacterium]